MDVEIWSDIACPWCYVGKRRFEAALAQFEHRDDVIVTWRAFELDPSAPPERPGDYVALLARKYGRSDDDARAMLDQMTQTAALDGLELRFDRIRPGNTFDGHRLVHLGAVHGRQDAMKERLMRAYLTDGELISDHSALARAAAEVGLPTDEVAALLASDRFAAEVRAEEQLAQGFGISAVPFFVVDRAIGIAGAQAPEVLLSGLQQGWDLAGSHQAADTV